MIRRTTQMATVVLSNHKFPEDGQVSIPLPIPPEEYDHYMEQLDELCIGHATWRDCMVDRIDSDYPALERLQGEMVNLDELDYLFQRLDSFDEHEKAAFQSVMYRPASLLPGRLFYMVLRRGGSEQYRHLARCENTPLLRAGIFFLASPFSSAKKER